MTRKQQLYLFYIVSAVFVVLNALFIYNEFYWFTMLPAVLLIAGMALFSMDKLMLLIVFFTPLSLSLEKMEFGLGVFLPTEPLMFGVMCLFLLKVFYDHRFDQKILKHPITVVVIIQLIWIFITSITSEMPVVSLKYFLARMWFVVTFYFLATQLFRRVKNIDRFFWLYIIPMTGVIIYTVIHHFLFGFEEQPAHWVMQPFFKDHTSYGAILAMFFPALLGYLTSKRFQLTTKIMMSFVLGIFILGIILSYTRAAWVSLVGALGVYLLITFRIKFRTVLIVLAVLAGAFFSFQEEIFMKLEKNRQDSSGDLTEHVQSISNVASDASNLERINRWKSALRMFEERPVFGWGPGTYMFQYAPFQHSADLTVISTNFGNKGNAHSEYLGPLAEMGVLGALTMLVLVGLVCYKAITLYFQLESAELKMLLLTAFLGLVTYFTHGILNNFLDTDKASVPFWGFIALIVAIDVYREDLEKAAGK